MTGKPLSEINWRRPTHDDLRSLYFAYMDLLTLAVIHYEDTNEEPSPYVIDDARTVICYGSGLTIEQFNRLVARGAKVLAKEGVPEVFITDLANSTEHEVEDLIGALAELYNEYLEIKEEIDIEFNEIIARQKGIG